MRALFVHGAGGYRDERPLADAVVPIEHRALNAARLPSARVHEHPEGGHQLDGLARPIAAGFIGARRPPVTG